MEEIENGREKRRVGLMILETNYQHKRRWMLLEEGEKVTLWIFSSR